MIREKGIGILDYGCGNLTSLERSLNKVGYRSKLLTERDNFKDVNTVIIPGVGAFPKAMDKIKSSGLYYEIHEAADAGKKIIGICLGMQLLADKSYEITECEGLGFIPGKVVPHPHGLQVGWMPIAGAGNDNSTFQDKYFYFNHNYYMETDRKFISYYCDTAFKYASIVQNRNVLGIQFHPEKSQQDGLDLLHHAVSGAFFEEQ